MAIITPWDPILSLLWGKKGPLELSPREIYVGQKRIDPCLAETLVRWMSQKATDDMSTLVQGNGLVPTGTKPLPQPMLNNICGNTMPTGNNELIKLTKHLKGTPYLSFHVMGFLLWVF